MSESKPRGTRRPKLRRKPKASAAPSSAPTDGAQRLQKVLAAAGVGSRRDCETLITTGRVEVDGRLVNVLGTKVDPHKQQIRVDGQPIKLSRRVHYAVYKPPGIISTHNDPSGRPRVIDLLPPSDDHLFTVGRLDVSSEGLILVTNDGELANRLAHPRYGVEKTYQVLVAGQPGLEVLEKMRKGVYLAEGRVHAERVEIKLQHKHSTILELVLDEGRNREVRRMLARLGHKVMRLRRIAIGPLRLGDLQPGEFRRLTSSEVEMLRRATHGDARRRREEHAAEEPVRHEPLPPLGPNAARRSKPADKPAARGGRKSQRLKAGPKSSARPGTNSRRARGQNRQRSQGE
ncbi:MAG: rRNA pseudouridine synthase [Planctomycetes bacterium]|nr:rRNA pseudouridine synthase [Planctomycetota bacterium]